MLLMLATGCAFKSVHRDKHIVYNPADKGHIPQELNVFAPSKTSTLKPVLIFVYGGNWNSGNKKLYSYFGSRMARKDVVTVITDYPKSPAAGYQEMATDIAAAVKWVKENIQNYGGDPNRVFISGHSAGGHLAALVSIREDYFKQQQIDNPVKGIILIDAAGLDMYNYLKEEQLPAGDTYLQTFSNDPATWKAASPIYFLHKGMPPMLIYQGAKTYPSISSSNERFTDSLKNYDVKFSYHILPGKKHVAMITQFFNPYNKRYKEMITFMQANR
jgi:acetyl esterase/lipase